MTAFPRFGVQGQVALVTGAARGLGRAIALALADAGADVALGLRDVDADAGIVAEIERLGSRAYPLQMDVSRKDEISSAVEAAVAQFGRLDILVNNAGVAPENPAEDVREDDFDQTLAVNLKGTFFTSQAVGRIMILQGYGRIVNIGSQAGFIALPGESIYCMTKAAISRQRGRADVHRDAGHRTLARRPGLPRRRARTDRRAAPHRRADGGRGRGGVPRLARGVADHRRDHPDRRRLDRPLGLSKPHR